MKFHFSLFYRLKLSNKDQKSTKTVYQVKSKRNCRRRAKEVVTRETRSTIYFPLTGTHHIENMTLVRHSKDDREEKTKTWRCVRSLTAILDTDKERPCFSSLDDHKLCQIWVRKLTTVKYWHSQHSKMYERHLIPDSFIISSQAKHYLLDIIAFS